MQFRLRQAMARLFGFRREEPARQRPMPRPTDRGELATSFMPPSTGQSYQRPPGPRIQPADEHGPDRVVHPPNPEQQKPADNTPQSDRPTIPNLRDLLDRIMSKYRDQTGSGRGQTFAPPALTQEDYDAGRKKHFGDIMGGKMKQINAAREEALARDKAAKTATGVRSLGTLGSRAAMAGKALGAAGVAAGLLVAAWKKASSAAMRNAEQLQAVNGVISAEMNRLTVDRMRRNIQTAQATSPSFRRMLRSRSNLEEQWQPIRNQLTKLANTITTVGNNAAAELLKPLNAMVEFLVGEEEPTAQAPPFVNFLSDVADGKASQIGQRPMAGPGGGGGFLPKGGLKSALGGVMFPMYPMIPLLKNLRKRGLKW